MTSLNQKAQIFHALHHNQDMLVLANIWDPISALIVAKAGAKAIATASAAMAEALGYPDGEQIPKDEMLGAIARIARVVTLPLTVDIERGYGETKSALQDTIERLIDMGVCGINIEDSLVEGGELRKPSDQALRIEAVRETAKKLGVNLFINARIDCFLQKGITQAEAITDTLLRAKAYEKAGCNGVFPVGVHDLPIIQQLRTSIKLPLNLIHIPTMTSLQQLQAAAVDRVSVGPFFMRASMASVQNIADQLLMNADATPLEIAMDKQFSLKALLVNP